MNCSKYVCMNSCRCCATALPLAVFIMSCRQQQRQASDNSISAPDKGSCRQGARDQVRRCSASYPSSSLPVPLGVSLLPCIIALHPAQNITFPHNTNAVDMQCWQRGALCRSPTGTEGTAHCLKGTGCLRSYPCKTAVALLCDATSWPATQRSLLCSWLWSCLC
jgi:hypothetical protein